MAATDSLPTMSSLPTGRSAPVDGLPSSVRLALELERRGLAVPAGLGRVVGELRRRGILGQEPGSASLFAMSGDEQQRRAAERFARLEAQPAPTEGQRAAYIEAQERAWREQLGTTERARRESLGLPLGTPAPTPAGMRSQYAAWPAPPTLPGTTVLAAPEIPADAVERFRAKAGERFDNEHSTGARFVQQRQELADDLAEQLRADNPQASEQQVLRRVQEELARAGYTPAGAGQLPVAGVRPEEPEPGVQGADRLPIIGDFLAPVVSTPIRLVSDAAGVGAGMVAQVARILGAEDAAFGAIGVQQALGRGQEKLIQELGWGRAETDSLARNVIADLGQFAGDLAVILATRNPAATTKAAAVGPGMAYFGTTIAGSTQDQVYNTLLAKGIDPLEASRRATYAGVATGLANAMLERIPLTAYLTRPAAVGRLKRAAQGVLAEGSTEAVQELAGILIELGVDANDAGYWENLGRILYAGGVGGLAGGIAGGAIPDAIRVDVDEEAGRGNPLAAAMGTIDRTIRGLFQRAQATEGATPPPDNVPSGDQQPGSSRSDPKILATPRQTAAWFARTYDDPHGAASIAAEIGRMGERMRLVDLPVGAIEFDPSALDADKVAWMAELGPAGLADLPPIMLMLNEDGNVEVLDGGHRLAAHGQLGVATIRGYVPESLAQSLEAGTALVVDRPEERPVPGPQAGPDGGDQAPRGVGESGPDVEVEAEPPPPAPPEPMARAAAELGLEFGGVQEGLDEPLFLYTDPQTESTLAATAGEDIVQKLEQLRARFAPADEPPPATTQEATDASEQEEATPTQAPPVPVRKQRLTNLPPELIGRDLFSFGPGEVRLRKGEWVKFNGRRRRFLPPELLNEFERVPKEATELLERVRAMTDEVLPLKGSAAVGQVMVPAQALARLRAEGFDVDAAVKEAIAAGQAAKAERRARRQANPVLGKRDRDDLVHALRLKLRLDDDVPEAEVVPMGREAEDPDTQLLARAIEHMKPDKRYRLMQVNKLAPGVVLKIGSETYTIEETTDPMTGEQENILRDDFTYPIGQNTVVPVDRVEKPKKGKAAPASVIGVPSEPVMPGSVLPPSPQGIIPEATTTPATEQRTVAPDTGEGAQAGQQLGLLGRATRGGITGGQSDIPFAEPSKLTQADESRPATTDVEGQQTFDQVERPKRGGGAVSGSVSGAPGGYRLPGAWSSPGAGSFNPNTGQVQPGGRRRKGPKGPAVPVPSGYTNDLNPLEAAEGKFRRNRSDSTAGITKGIAAARARRDAGDYSDADNIFKIISDVARRFNLGAPGVGRAKLLKRWAAGFYRIQPESIRLGKGSYPSTFFHELGHHIHKTLFKRATRRTKAGKTVPVSRRGIYSAMDFPPAWRPELQTLGKDLYGDKEPLAGGYASEGWAETVRQLITNPKHLKARAPTVYSGVVRLLSQQHPEIWFALLESRVRLANAVAAMQINPVHQFIDYGRRWLGEWGDFFSWETQKTLWFDRFHRLTTFKKDLGLEKLAADVDPYTAALRANGHISGDMKIAWELGTFDPADARRTPTGPGMLEILKPVRSALDLFQEYMVARRTLEKRGQGYNVLPIDADLTLPGQPPLTSNSNLQKFIRQVERHHPDWGDYFKTRGPQVEVGQDAQGQSVMGPSEDPDTVAAKFQQFNRWLIGEYAVHYGLITPAAAELIMSRNLEYITFRHKKTEDAVMRRGGARSGSGFTGRGSGIRRFREGHGEQLFPPLETFYASMQSIIGNARLNEVARLTVDIFNKGVAGSGRWVDKIDRPMDAMKVSNDQLAKEIRDQLGIGLTSEGQLILPPHLQGLDQAAIDELITSLIGLRGATFWKPGNRTDKDNREVTVLIGGKPRFYEVKDKRLFDLLEGLGSPTAHHALVRFFGIPGRVLRAGATQLNPSFFIPNFQRDLFQALVMTDSDLRKLPQQARLRLAGMKAAFNGGDLYRLFLASGADMAGIFGEYYDPKGARLDFNAMFGTPRAYALVKGDSPLAIAKDVGTLGAVQRLNRSFELAVRMGEFNVVYHQLRGQGVAEPTAIAQAGQAAADITLDFQRGGAWAKQINQVLVFFNAAMLGTEKLARFIKANPIKAFGRIFGFMVLPSVLQALLNADNEDYWAKPMQQRDRHWYIPIGSDDQGRPMYLRILKPYGLGIFSIAAERSIARLWGIDPETGQRGDERAFRDMWVALLDEMRPTFNVSGIMPIVEVSAGEQGYSWFMGRTIVSDADKDLPLGMQGATRSSDLARVIGHLFQAANDAGAPMPDWIIPPAKIDYLIRGLFGGLGQDAVSTFVDPMIRAVEPGEQAGEPLEFNDWLIVRRFLAGPTRSGHEAITRFFDDYDHIVRVKRGLAAIGDQKDAEAYRQRHAAELDLAEYYEAARREAGAQFKALRGLYADKEMDADELEQRIDGHYEQIIDIAQAAHVARREAKSRP